MRFILLIIIIDLQLIIHAMHYSTLRHQLKLSLSKFRYRHSHLELTNSTEQSSPQGAYSHSSSQEVSHLLWNPKVYYHVHKSLLLVHILSQMNLIHNVYPISLKIHCNIILPYMPRSSAWSNTFRFSNQNFVCISHILYAFYMPHLSHSPWLDHTNNIWWREQVTKLLIMQFSPAFCISFPLRSKSESVRKKNSDDNQQYSRKYTKNESVAEF